MTKTLNSQLSRHDAPATRSPRRIRTWLVALLGFGAADVLVLNLWAVPSLITSSTTTDMRAAHSAEMQPDPSVPDPQPPAASAEPSEPPADHADRAEIAQPSAEPEPADPPAQAQAQAEDPQPEPAQPAEVAAQPEPPVRAESKARAAQQAGPRAEAPPGDAPALPAEANAAPEPGVTTASAFRAAQRALRVALQDRAAAGGTGPFDELSTEEQPLTQIYFSLGNYTLGPNGKLVLERMLPQLSADQRAILIVGSADPSGSEQVNEKLSDARAQSVAEWLLAHAVDASRIQTRAIGHEGAVGSTVDRRVDIWLGGSR
jgi:outer membrane protein OmpA-like peptidoglycan-associated protein